MGWTCVANWRKKSLTLNNLLFYRLPLFLSVYTDFDDFKRDNGFE